MDPVCLTGLHIYPIKSAKGICLTSAALGDRGLQHDRRWMIVDEQNAFLTQRKLPRMALIAVELASDHLVTRAPGMEELKIPLELPRSDVIRARVWDDIVETVSVGNDADRWFTGFLEHPCKLVYMPDNALRTVDPKYGSSRVSFADAFPLLLVSEESLQDLNRRLESPVRMNRFRPNLVVSGCEPYEEDEWQKIRIGSIAFQIAKPCARCIVPTVDQSTGIQGKEPIRTLATYRSRVGEVLFGQNVIHGDTGTVTVGDRIEVVGRR